MNDSIEEYLRALELDPTSPLIQYNLGTALAQQGEILKSEKALNQAAEQSHGKLRRDSLFNLGVSLADEQGSAGAPSGMPPGMMGLTLPQANSTGGAPTDKAADSAGQLKRSLEAFRNAILTDPADQEAKHNYELTLAKLRNQQQQQQQQQDQGESGGDESSSNDQQQGESGSQGQDQGKKDSSSEGEQSGQEQQENSDDKHENQQQQKGGGLEKETGKQDQGDQKDQDQQDQNSPEDGEQDQDKSGQQPQAGQSSAEPGPDDMNPDEMQDLLSPEQMDGQRLLNLLEEARPDQFKKLFRFQGDARQRKSVKDW